MEIRRRKIIFRDIDIRTLLMCICCLLYIFTISCTKKEELNPAFLILDYSYCDGWNNSQSIRIDSFGQTYVLHEHNRDGVTRCSFVLDNVEINKISNLVESIKNLDFAPNTDTNSGRVHDAVSFSILIKRRDNKGVKIECISRNLTEEEEKAYSLFKYLNIIIDKNIGSLKRVRFESRTLDFEKPLIPLIVGDHLE